MELLREFGSVYLLDAHSPGGRRRAYLQIVEVLAHCCVDVLVLSTLLAHHSLLRLVRAVFAT